MTDETRVAELEALRQELEVRDAIAAKLYPHIERLRTHIAKSGSRGDFVEEAAANLIDHQQQRIAALEAALLWIKDNSDVISIAVANNEVQLHRIHERARRALED